MVTALTFQDTKFNLHAYAIEPHRVLPGWVLIKFHISDPKISAVGPSCFFTNLCNAPEIRGERKITNYVHVFWLRSAKLKQAWLCARLHKKSHNPFFTFLLILRWTTTKWIDIYLYIYKYISIINVNHLLCFLSFPPFWKPKMGFWDFGILGVSLNTALMKVWRRRFPVQEGWALVRG